MAQLLEHSNEIVFFTGAGISTESGIPDFRSPGTGLWTKMQPIQFQDFMASEECSGLITQNVDNLHQNSGLAEEKIVELHGNATYASCLSCAQRYELNVLKVQFERDQNIAPCSECGGILKTATISFGQSMPEVPMQRATSMVEACDLMIVLGSSLTVYPAAGFPEYAKQLGAKLVIINREETGLDGIADLVIQQQIGAVMQQAYQRLQSLL